MFHCGGKGSWYCDTVGMLITPSFYELHCNKWWCIMNTDCPPKLSSRYFPPITLQLVVSVLLFLCLIIEELCVVISPSSFLWLAATVCPLSCSLPYLLFAAERWQCSKQFRRGGSSHFTHSSTALWVPFVIQHLTGHQAHVLTARRAVDSLWRAYIHQCTYAVVLWCKCAWTPEV